MHTSNGTTKQTSTKQTSIEDQFDVLKANLKNLVERFDAEPRGYLGKIQHKIKAHPFAAIGLAFGVGYLAVRLARWRR